MNLIEKLFSGAALSSTGRLTFVKQREEGGDALACIAMILAYHGSIDKLDDLINRYPSLQAGMGLRQMIEILAEFDLKTRALQCPSKELIKLRLPAVLHWDMKRFVVLSSINERHVIVFDPSLKVLKITLDELDQHFGEIALEVESPSKS